VLLKVQPSLFEEWVFRFGREMIVLSSHYPAVSGFYKLLAICFKICKDIDYFKVELNMHMFIKKRTHLPAGTISAFTVDACTYMCTWPRTGTIHSSHMHTSHTHTHTLALTHALCTLVCFVFCCCAEYGGEWLNRRCFYGR